MRDRMADCGRAMALGRNSEKQKSCEVRRLRRVELVRLFSMVKPPGLFTVGMYSEQETDV